MAMKLLLPIAANNLVTNIFDVLCRYSNELRSIVSGFTAPQGNMCENHRIFVHPAGKNGVADPLVLACTLVKLDNSRLVATLSDVSRQVVQERRLKQAETWFATLLDSVNDFAVVSLDQYGNVDGVNAAAAMLTGYSQDVMIGQPLDAFDTPERGSAGYSAQEQMAIAQRDGWHLDEGWRQRSDGERYWCQRLVAARSEDVIASTRVISGYTVILRDVTRGESDAAKLKELLTTDHLTGACNRAHFFDLAERQRLRLSLQNEPLALVVLDIDRFKDINDNFGHAGGDLALQAVTKLCRSLLRTNDTFARMGGEEFVFLLPAMGLEAAVRTAERLRLAIAAMPLHIAEDIIHITASFGCAVMSDKSETLGATLELADQRLYAAKNAGRNRVEPRTISFLAPPPTPAGSKASAGQPMSWS
jgi:diguanylate cyclase (GGDEF)-like protein/PAS domain S-box-containing protein